MTRVRVGSWMLGVVLLLVVVSRPTLAIGPAVIVIHGAALPAPVVVHPAIGSFMFMWGGGTFYDQQGKNAIPSGLEDRRYLDYDVFWGRFTPDELKPEAASQHGRVYLPTADQPAAVVLTSPAMSSSDPTATRAPATPIPLQLTDFTSGRALLPFEAAALATVGVPMK